MPITGSLPPPGRRQRRPESRQADAPPAPAALHEIDASWVEAALRSAGILDGAVATCRVSPIGSDLGFASAIARLEIDYRTGAGLPASLIAKLGLEAADPDLRQVLVRKFATEAAFYRDLSLEVGLRVPRPHFVAHEQATGRVALLLEDLREARFGDDGRGCSVSDARLVLRSLAAMHARWWQSARLADLSWLATFDGVDERLRALDERRRRFLERFGDLLGPQLRTLTERLGTANAPLLGRLAGPPVTLLHVDTHLDNICFVRRSADQEEAVLFDWQGAGKGMSVVDVAHFLFSALHGDDRSNEIALLEGYRHALLSRGVDYPPEALHHDYRVALLRWWLGTVRGYGSAAAGSWTGRQLQLARESIGRWTVIARTHRLEELI